MGPLLSFAATPNYPQGYNILGVRQGANDDCLLNNELAWDLGCDGFNNAPRDADNQPITDCNACACDNNCKVINCDGKKDWNGKLCTDSCKCTPDCGENDPGCILGGTKGAGGGPPPEIGD